MTHTELTIRASTLPVINTWSTTIKYEKKLPKEDFTFLLILLYLWTQVNTQVSLRSLVVSVSTGQRNDSVSSEGRQHRASVEELHSPKPADGVNMRLASVQSSSYDCNSVFPKLVSEVSQELLASGAVILPGTGVPFKPTSCFRVCVCVCAVHRRTVGNSSEQNWQHSTAWSASFSLIAVSQETEIAAGEPCCRCARELTSGQVRRAQSTTWPVYSVTTTPLCGESYVLRV